MSLFTVVLEETHEASRGHLKGAVLALKALQGSETKKLPGAVEENSVSPLEGNAVAFYFLQKAN